MPTAEPPDQPWDSAVRAGETDMERIDRNLSELLSELRVSINGAQVLFAFLLIVPFSSGFHQVDARERTVYFATLVIAALSTTALVAPAVMHRVVFRRHAKRELVKVASRTALTGQALLTMAVAGAVWMIGDYLYGLAVAMAMATLALMWSTSWFFLVPLHMRRTSERTRPPGTNVPLHG